MRGSVSSITRWRPRWNGSARSCWGADDRISETIKWKTPTFVYEGNIASFNPRAKAHVSLLFHTGASIPGKHALLEGGGDTARYARFDDLDDVEAKREQLEAVVRAWCALKDGA
jgi:hypothetical protein